MKLISFDPGETTGWAIFEDCTPKEFGNLQHVEELYPFLRDRLTSRYDYQLDICIVEDYKVRPVNKAGYSHLWSSVGPARIIGAIQYICWDNNINFVLQQPSDKTIGARLMGLPAKPTQGKHYQDALCHAVTYLHKQGLWKHG